jgi:2-haloacid dehalogenase
MTERHFDAIVFDAYGTLLDVHAAMARHAERLGHDWQAFATEWRLKQLEYSWIDNMTVRRARRDFAACTADALDYVLTRHALDTGLRPDLLAAYERLDAYAEVPTVLDTLRRRGFRLAILSNGTPKMLMAACQAANIAALLDAIISVEQAGSFKPAPAVYGLVQTELGAIPARTLFVSGNPWDSQAALSNGFAVVRVNRGRDPDEYDLRRHLIAELHDLTGLPALLPPTTEDARSRS